ncbi:MAG: hypothetical protein ABIK84_00035 [candidate division WOR-3 bacterium]
MWLVLFTEIVTIPKLESSILIHPMTPLSLPILFFLPLLNPCLPNANVNNKPPLFFSRR